MAHYTPIQALRKILFYPLCVVCGAAAKRTPFLCGGCMRALAADLKQRQGQDAYALSYEMAMPWLKAWHSRTDHMQAQLVAAFIWRFSYFSSWARKQKFDAVICLPSSAAQEDHTFSSVDWCGIRLANYLNIPIYLGALCKVKRHRQHEQNAADRLDTELFLGWTKSAPDIGGKRILLLDDVYTTGTSLLQAQYLLQQAGALSSDYFTITRKILEIKEPRRSEKIQDSTSDVRAHVESTELSLQPQYR